MSDPAQTVFVVDDDPSFLATMTRWLRAFGYSVKSYSSAMDFIAQRPTHAPGCVVADLEMPGMDGMELQSALAQSCNPLPIIFLTGHGDIPSSVQAMRLGAEDFLTKTAGKHQLLGAIERALARDLRERGARHQKDEHLSRFAKLTPREKDVLRYVVQGRLNKQIAAELRITERSVKRHRTSIMHKLEVRSVAELVQLAMIAKVIGEMI